VIPGQHILGVVWLQEAVATKVAEHPTSHGVLKALQKLVGEGGGFVEAEAGFRMRRILIRVILAPLEEPVDDDLGWVRRQRCTSVLAGLVQSPGGVVDHRGRGEKGGIVRVLSQERCQLFECVVAPVGPSLGKEVESLRIERKVRERGVREGCEDLFEGSRLVTSHEIGLTGSSGDRHDESRWYHQ